MIRQFVFMIMLLAFGTVQAQLSELPFIISQGIAEKEIKPDVAEINLKILSFRAVSEDAMQDVNTATDNVIKTLEENGINKSHLEATNLVKQTVRDWDENYNKLSLKGYEVSRKLVIKLKDLSAYQDIVGQLMAFDNVTEVEAKFDVLNKKELAHKLILAAGKDARRQADSMAEAMGVEIATVQAISEDRKFEIFDVRYVTSPDTKRRYRMEPKVSTSKMLVPSHITLHQNIHVVFRIKQ